MRIKTFAAPAAFAVAAALSLTACITPAANQANPVDVVTDTVVVTAPDLAQTPAEAATATDTTADAAPAPATAIPASRFDMANVVAPTTFDEHLQFLADNLRKYNEVAPELWTGNAVTDVFAIVENAQTHELYLVTSAGEHRALTEAEAIEFGFDPESRDIGYHKIEEYPATENVGTVGYFAAINLDEVNDWTEKSPSFGPMLPFKMGVHEAFHTVEQGGRWANPFDAVFNFETNEMLVSEEELADLVVSVNADREEFLDDFDARVARRLLIRDLRLAAANPGDEEKVLQALATYRDFKEKFPEQHDMARNQDRGEGTASYFDNMASLKVLMPEEVQTREDMQEALAFWIAQRNYEEQPNTGLVMEGYYVGMLGAVILDRYVDAPVWQQAIMDDYNATPLSLLAAHFADRELPSPSVADQAFKDRTAELIAQREAGITDGATPTY